MKNQPPTCERCGAKLFPNGTPCTQIDCNYLKADEGDGDDAYGEDPYGENGGPLNWWFRKSNRSNKVNDEKEQDQDQIQDSEDSQNDSGSNNEEDGGGGDGCLVGFLKLIWKVISFPFRVVFWILSIFDGGDDD